MSQPVDLDSRPGLLAPAGAARLLGSLRLGRFSGVYLWIVFVGVFAVWIPNLFLTTTTAQSVANEQAIVVILALAAVLNLSAGALDLSIGQNLGLGACVCVILITHGVATPFAALATIGTCGAAGLLNAFLVVGVGLEALIATLGTSSVLLAITEIITNNQYVGPTRRSFQTVVSYKPLGIPVLVIYALVAAAVVWYVLEHTPIGRRIAATGANPDTARLAGIPTRRYALATFVTSGLVAGVAAFLLAAKLGTVSPTIGPGYLLPVYAAAFLSATQIKPGRFNVWGTVIAIYLLATGVKGLVLAGGQLWITDLFNGVALITALALSLTLQRRQVARS